NTIMNVGVHYVGLGSNPQSNRYDTGVMDNMSRVVIDQSYSTARSGSRYPTSAMNLIRNGDLRYGYQDFYRSSGPSQMTLTMNPGMGLYGQYVNCTITAGQTRTLHFQSV